ncbi:MAG: hypothetical protein N3A61_01350, partial [Ignavibacteria bacterium]|nr:hypothetical protein [Ignavibacteria bacterium]
SELMDKSKLLLDLNILAFRQKEKVTQFPTLIQTGIESYELVRSASIGAPRIVIYAESSINPQDFVFLPHSLASSVSYTPIDNGYEVNSPYSFQIKLPKNIKVITIDNSPFTSFRDNLFLIPAGKHTIKFSNEGIGSFSTYELQANMLSITANLLSISHGLRNVTIEYEADTKVLASFNNQPTKVVVDGEDYQLEVMKGNDCFTIYLPSGRHQIEITAGDQFTYGISLTSLWSTTAIAIFGFLAVSLLVLLFLILKIYRRRYAS